MLNNPKVQKILDALDGGSQNTSALSRLIRTPRTTVEYILRSLERDSYVRSKKSGRETIWEKIMTYDKKTKTIHGIKNIINAFENAVGKKNLEVVVIESDQSMAFAEDKKYNDLFKKLNEKFREKNALVYILFHRKTINRIKAMVHNHRIKDRTVSALINRGMSAHLLPDDLFDLNIHIAVIGKRVFFTDFRKEKSQSIDNDLLATFFKHIFLFIAQTQEKVNVGEILKDLVNGGRM